MIDQLRTWGVYRVLKNGSTRYLPQSCTTNRRLAEDIALERSRGEITLPTGQIIPTVAYPHIVQEI